MRSGSPAILGRPALAGPTPAAPARRAGAVPVPVGRAAVVRAAVAGVLLFALALLPRAQNLGRYVTVDEDLTLGRTGNFAAALLAARWERTYQIGHPEVTTMWVATMALGPDRARRFAGSVNLDGRAPEARRAINRPEFLEALERARLGLALANSLLVAAAGLLLWRLAGPAAGLLGGALLALEPFLVAHGQLLRADAMLAELMLLAVLAAAAYWLRGAGAWALLLAIGTTGLALLTKTPAVILLPIVGGIALVARRRWWAVPLWLLGAVALYVGLWPAMWVRPVETIRRVAEYTAVKGGAPMDAGSYLFGQALADPGPLFYPTALLLRLSPLAILGVLVLLWRRPTRDRAVAGVLLATVLVVGLAITPAPKKADRYILPLIPCLVALAGLGAADLVRRRRTVGLGLGLGIVVVGQSVGLLAVWPYWLSYYNPLAGGGPAAARSIPVGWGEGLDRVAEALDRLPDASRQTVAVFYPDALGAQLDARTVPLEAYDVADFAVLYVASEQRGLTPPALAAALADRSSELDVELNGIRYARVFRLPAPEFEGGILLDDIDVSTRSVGPRDPVRATVRWAVQAPPGRGVRSRLVLLRSDGQVMAESRGPLHAEPEAGQLLEERHLLRAPSRYGRYAVALSLEGEPDVQPLAVVRRPPGLEESPTRLIFRSLRVRVS